MDIVEAKEELEKKLIGRDGVVGVGANVDRGFIVVYVESKSDCMEVPEEFEGYRVECVPVGKTEFGG